MNRSHVLWLTGLSGSGKTALAHAVQESLAASNFQVVCLDGDKIRQGLSSDLGFSREDRKENIRRISEMAKLLADTGKIVLVSVISPYEADRLQAKTIIGAERFSEIYVSCPLEVCIQRDVKGLYRRAIAKEIPEFTGISSPYEEPTEPALKLNTDRMSKVDCAALIVQMVSLAR